MKYFRAPVLFVCIFAFTAFSFTQDVEGTFLCRFNGKDWVLKGANAKYRTITGGHKQLSLSNEKFEAFVIINPEIGKIELSEKNNREVYVRYVEPGTDRLYKPVKGFVDIQRLDLEKGLVSGVFEMVLINRDGAAKKITVSNGKFENIPIQEISGY